MGFSIDMRTGLALRLGKRNNLTLLRGPKMTVCFSLDVYLRCFLRVTDLENLLLLLSSYSSLGESKCPQNTRFDQYSYVQRLIPHDFIPVLYFQPLWFDDSLLFTPSVLLFWIPLEYCTQTTAFTRSKTHASPTRTTPTCSLMRDAAHVWSGWHDVSGISCRHLGLPQTPARPLGWLNTPYSHTATPCIHTE